MKYLLKTLIILLLIYSTGCLNDNIVPVVNSKLDESAKILQYLESQGDFANSEAAPGLISASNIYNNLWQFFVLDIRTEEEYSKGHIENSLNVSTSRLYEVVDSLHSLDPSKTIVLVSKNGQASAYFVCLLRLAGFNNTFTLNYGMAYWHVDFAGEWLQALKDEKDLDTYQNQNYPKKLLTALPKIDFPASLENAEKQTIYRIKEVIKKGFTTDVNYSDNFNADIKSSHLKICYGQEKLYVYPPRDLGAMGHAPETIWYVNSSDFEFRSIKSLQTLPTDQPIIIYSSDGQLSASMTAYLTVLGYDIKTLLFGANQLFYPRMRLDPQLVDGAFKPEAIINYPYVTGN